MDGAGNSGVFSVPRSIILDTPISTSSRDTLTGTSGVDTFLLPELSHSLLGTAIDPTFDTIVGFQNIDCLQVSGRAYMRRLTASAGAAAGLNPSQLTSILPSTLAANSATPFTAAGFTGTFIALNDGQIGYQSNLDAIIFLSGYTISNANSISVL